MKILVLTALIAAVASGPLSGQSSPANQEEWPWQQGKLYRYDVESHTLASMQEGASTGSAFKAHFIVRVKSNGRLLAKLENAQHAQVHQELSGDKNHPKDLEYKPVKDLDRPFEIYVDGGLVLSLQLPSTTSLSQENLLKGLISALQVDLSDRTTSSRDAKPNNSYDKDSNQAQFTTMETDITGSCETLYTVSPVASEWRRELPNFTESEDPIEITKSKSYNRCYHRVAYHFGVPEGAEWTGTARKTDEQQFIKRSTISRILAGKQGPIYKAETTSTVHVHPHLYGKQKAQVHSHVQLNLVSFEQDKEAEWPKLEGGRTIQNLLFAMSSKQVDLSKSSSQESQEQDQSEASLERQRRSVNRHGGYSGSSSSSSESASSYVNDDIPDSKESAYATLYRKQNPMNAQKLVQELAQQLQNPSEMPKSDFLSKFNVLKQVILSMSYEQLSQTSRSIEVAKSSNNIVKSDMWMVYRDAVAQAGTLPAFKQIRSWIQKKKIEGEEAAQVVASMVSALRFPTKETMTQFFKLAMSDEVRQQKNLHSTALIAATRFINMAQINNETAHSYYPTHMYGRLARQHDEFVNEEIVPRLQKELEAAIKQGDSQKAQVYIKAIGNLGHHSTIEVFVPYLEGKIPVSNYLRVQMVENLKILAHQRDHYVRAVLYNILKNTAEPYEVRVAAIQNIFLAHPTSAMMQAMAQMTHEDPSMHVRAVLKSGIESASQLKHPRYWKLARTAQVARSLLTEQKFGKQYAARKYDDFFDSEYEHGIMSELSLTGSEDSLFPKSLEYSLKTKSGWNSISASFSSVQQFVDNFNRQWQQDKSDSNHKYSADKISQMLNIESDPQQPLEAALFINLMNQQRYFTFSEQDLKQLPETMKRYCAELSKGVEKHYTKVFNRAQTVVMFPVAMGMPFIYKYMEPTVVHINSKAKGDVKFPSSEQKHYSGYIDKEIEFTYARNLDGSVGFMDTLSNQIASVGVINKFQLNIPVKMQIKMESGQVHIQLEHLRPNEDATIAHYSVWPYSTIQKQDTLVTVSQDTATKVISRKSKVVSIDTHLASVYKLKGYSYSSDYKNLHRMFQSGNLVSGIASALCQNDVAMTHYNLKYLGKENPLKRATFTAVYDSFYNQKENAQGPLAASNQQDTTPNSEARRKEMAKRVASGINTAKVEVVDLSATFETSYTVQYVFTGAMGHSPVDAKRQYTFFAGKAYNGGEGQQINGVLTVNKPETISLNFLEALQKDLKMSFVADIKYGDNGAGNIHIQGQTERSQKYAEALKNEPLAKQCAEEIAHNNYYQNACHKMIVMAHAPDHFKVSVTDDYRSPVLMDIANQAYRMGAYLGFWYSHINPYKIAPRGKLDIEVQTNYLENSLELVMKSAYGEARMNNVPIPKMSAQALSTYSPFKPCERVQNYYTSHQYQPYCSIDGNQIRTFSNRRYDYTLSRAWHVVMQDSASRRQNMQQQQQQQQQAQDELVVLARKSNEKQQEIYISYRSETGKNFEIEIKPSEGSNKPQMKVTTNSKKVSEGDLTMYWDDAEEAPLLQYYTQPDGVLMLNIREDRLRAMYDGQRLVVLSRKNRNNIRGICGAMNGEPRDDYRTPEGLVDQAEHYGASYSLHEENSEPETQKLQAEAKKLAYERKFQFTKILRADRRWHGQSPSSQEKWGSQKIYRAQSYLKEEGGCRLQNQVQYYENHSEICITTKPLNSCQSQCRGQQYKVQGAQVVCRPKLDQQFQEYKNQIHQGQNPQVSGVPHNKQYKVPTSCKA